MRLTLQTLTGRKYYIEATEHHKVRDIKKAIFNNLEMKNRLRLLWMGQEMEDCYTLYSLGITKDDTISLVEEPDSKIKLNIKTFKKGMVCVEVNSSSTVPELNKLLLNSGIGPSTQPHDFYFDSAPLCDNKIPLYMYGITDGSTIVQKHGGSFKLKLIDSYNNEFVKFFTVRGSDTVQDLTKKVLTIINERHDLTTALTEDDIVIFHHKKDIQKVIMYDELDCDTCTVSECNVEPLDIITFVWYNGEGVLEPLNFSVDLKVKGASSLKFPKLYGIANMESVHSLRLKIQHQLHIPFHRQVVSVLHGKTASLANSHKIYRDQFYKNLVCLEVLKEYPGK